RVASHACLVPVRGPPTYDSRRQKPVSLPASLPVATKVWNFFPRTSGTRLVTYGLRGLPDHDLAVSINVVRDSGYPLTLTSYNDGFSPSNTSFPLIRKKLN
ncbi:hypothetical protein BaRGS_00022018, partial [Batillaria attramentaria]